MQLSLLDLAWLIRLRLPFVLNRLINSKLLTLLTALVWWLRGGKISCL